MGIPDRLKGESFKDYILRTAQGCPQFTPNAHYFRDGDFIQCYLEDESCYTKSACDHVSVHLADSDDRIVGFNIHAVHTLIDESQADRIAALEAENEKLRSALRPFAEIGARIDKRVREDAEWESELLVSDLRTAAKTLKGASLGKK